jgi:nitrate/nitrite-specific signal transduction histidine kinase
LEGSGRRTGPAGGQEQLLRWDERRRVAKDLHDSTSQLLVLLDLQLARLRRSGASEALPLIEECSGTIREIREQIRSLDLDESA